MRTRIYEIRNGRPFSAEETENGVTNIDTLLNWRGGSVFERMQPSRSEREDDIEWLRDNLRDVLSVTDDKLLFSQEGYDAFVASFVAALKKYACDITPEAFFPVQQSHLADMVAFDTFPQLYVYNADADEVQPILEWLFSTGVYDGDDDGRVFYIGKIYDCHI